MNCKQPRVLILILNYGTYDLTINLVKDITTNLDYENFSIMVVDNCSPNESVEVLEMKSKELGYIFYANNVNAGYAAGNNIGIRYGIEQGYEYTLILNNDVVIKEKDILSHMISIAQTDESVGCVGPRIHNSNGNICAPYIDRPNLWTMTFGIALEKKKRQKYTSVSRYVYRVYGCCMLLKNRVMNEINGMDERTFLYGEEDILSERMLSKGYVSFYDSEVGVTHMESESINRMSKNRKKIQAVETKKSMELYLKEYRHYLAPARWLCHVTRSLIIYLR